MIKSFTSCQRDSLTPSCYRSNKCRGQEHKFNNTTGLFWLFLLEISSRSVRWPELLYVPEEVTSQFLAKSQTYFLSAHKTQLKQNQRFRGNWRPTTLDFQVTKRWDDVLVFMFPCSSKAIFGWMKLNSWFDVRIWGL